VDKLAAGRGSLEQELWDSLNFSLLELLGKASQGQSQGEMLGAMVRVVSAVLSKGGTAFRPRLLHLAAFLLCLLDEASSFMVMAKLL
jgi:hypothetical protein